MVISWDFMGFTIWLFNTWKITRLLIDKPSINGSFSMAMLNNQRVTKKTGDLMGFFMRYFHGLGMTITHPDQWTVAYIHRADHRMWIPMWIEWVWEAVPGIKGG